MQRITRKRLLTKKEGRKYQKIREQLEAEFNDPEEILHVEAAATLTQHLKDKRWFSLVTTERDQGIRILVIHINNHKISKKDRGIVSSTWKDFPVVIRRN